MSQQPPLISICIPTYRRPEFLKLAIESCLNQTYPNIEIVVSDDSPDDRTEEMIRGLKRSDRIRYVRNRPALRQAANTTNAFNLAKGDRLVLLHDDDLLLPNAVADLASAWDLNPNLIMSYGKYQMMDADGRPMPAETREFYQFLEQTPTYPHWQRSLWWMVLSGLFAPNGFMIRTDVAQKIGYSTDPAIGDACDLDFDLRLAQNYDDFWFVNEYISVYRMAQMNSESAKDNSTSANYGYRLMESTQVPAELQSLKSRWLKNIAPYAISRWLHFGNKRTAARIYFSSHYPWKRRLSPKGLAQLLILLLPARWGTELLASLKNLKHSLKGLKQSSPARLRTE